MSMDKLNKLIKEFQYDVEIKDGLVEILIIELIVLSDQKILQKTDNSPIVMVRL